MDSGKDIGSWMGIEPSVLGGSLLNLYWMERHVPFPTQRQILIKKNLEDHYQSGLLDNLIPCWPLGTPWRADWSPQNHLVVEFPWSTFHCIFCKYYIDIPWTPWIVAYKFCTSSLLCKNFPERPGAPDELPGHPEVFRINTSKVFLYSI